MRKGIQVIKFQMPLGYRLYDLYLKYYDILDYIDRAKKMTVLKNFAKAFWRWAIHISYPKFVVTRKISPEELEEIRTRAMQWKNHKDTIRIIKGEEDGN